VGCQESSLCSSLFLGLPNPSGMPNGYTFHLRGNDRAQLRKRLDRSTRLMTIYGHKPVRRPRQVQPLVRRLSPAVELSNAKNLRFWPCSITSEYDVHVLHSLNEAIEVAEQRFCSRESLLQRRIVDMQEIIPEITKLSHCLVWTNCCIYWF
jgi:hypothetical protein